MLSLHLQNFQSHKETRIAFHPGVNAIIGSSDSGKSALLRALKWALFNKPGGEAFCSFWGGDTLAKVEINGRVVARSRGKENAYFLDGEKYLAFGAGTLDAIAKAHKALPVNFQEQMDSPYLLSLSAGEVAKILNKAVDLDCIDHVSARLRAQVSAAHACITDTQQSIAEQKEELLRYSIIKQVAPLLEKARACGHKADLLMRKRAEAQRIVSALLTQPDWKQRRKQIAHCERLLAAAAEKETSIKEKTHQAKLLRQRLKGLIESRESLQSIKERLASKEAYLKKHMPKVCPLCQAPIKNGGSAV